MTTDNLPALVGECDIDHSIKPSCSFEGGRLAAERTLAEFIEMSPYLHFGYISSLELALAVKKHADENKLITDEFLDELIVRRELAFNFARYSDDPESLDNVPNWARRTLREHAADTRDFAYSREQFEHAQTHDRLWNATQKEMLLRGKIHGYYRMYWGKKIIEWTAKPEDALKTMIYIHDRYALDGRDPNTYTNILWCLECVTGHAENARSSAWCAICLMTA